jgi:asparagine synthase (glutamine-hydrolysing)
MDIATMASSLEARSPLLDHELMEFAASCRRSSRCAVARRRSCSRRRCAAGSPTRSSTRPSAASAFRSATGCAANCATSRATCCSTGAPADRGCFAQDYVRELLDRHAAGVQDHSQGIWTLLMFELWHQQFIDASAA